MLIWQTLSTVSYTHLMKIIEKNTKLLSLNDVDSGNIVVNFSGEFLTGDNTKDVLAVYAVVKSLCAISLSLIHISPVSLALESSSL